MDNLHNITKPIEIPLVTKSIELYKIFYQYLELFPKKDKYALGAKCEKYLLETLELFLAAGGAPLLDKKRLVQQANVKFDALKIFLRLAKELKMLDIKKYIELQKYLQEIGRMLGGWQKSLL
ncbi:MAG TPA: diversity-generating retroelement protein bAvd family protein [Candidatus Magasanikbacteria bacterium]|uniref:bAvd-like domain-containing protein n=2 Tax=Candidatus Magasanikiibacteriota TaxID=1752731 RepID=A0A0G0WI10_9BACT|nr:MAG: hypothetical protein UU49_C0011G0039 [Candidatus Magasanikbacteria bacterium GW2011_GWC2_41_17]KKS12520.1 MAG: hypothetical protein UU69_C0033G0003 [Candidatus Magasanikbacteria bacterium GW2011_GWA2_41_55]HBV58288.1 diversity-generating retroelement protein bAvd family protein [Candidatus Magasanikbacteria bacterium]HBX15788.1 diversity-generating retroelement protein bAvd family protein [Candidatus Magasanikbacteria bacterium]